MLHFIAVAILRAVLLQKADETDDKPGNLLTVLARQRNAIKLTIASEETQDFNSFRIDAALVHPGHEVLCSHLVPLILITATQSKF